MWSPAQRSDELYHWIPFRGSREKHKYIAKVQEGKHTRYFYTQEEYNAYKNLTDKQANPSRTEPRGLVAKAKHFVDYDLTGVGYRRDARQKNKEIDELKKLKSDNPLKEDADKVKEFRDRNIRISKKYHSELDKINDKEENWQSHVTKSNWKDAKKANVSYDEFNREREAAKENRDRQLEKSHAARKEYQESAKRKNLQEQILADREKKANTEQAEKDFKDKSLVGKATKVGDFIKNFNRNLEDQKTAKWMKKNADYAQQWMKDLGIDKSVYDPSKEANSSKLKKYLKRNKNSGNGAVSDLRDGESLQDYFERKGYVTKEKGKTRYHKQKQNRRKDSASLKKSSGFMHADAKGSVVGNKQPDKFKYMAKVGEGNNTRYFYSQEELDAYKKTLSKDELAKTNIQMMNESQADMDLIDRKALQKSIDKEKSTTAEKEKSEPEAAKAETTDEESEKKSKGGSGGGGGKGGSGKGKGKGKGKGGAGDKDKEETQLKIGKMSDKELVQYLNKNKKLADQILSQMGLSKKDLDTSKGLDVASLRKAFTKNDLLNKNDKDVSLYSVLDALGQIQKPTKKNKSAKASTLAHTDEEFLGLEIYTEELYHYGRKGMKWYQHIYGPVQSIAKYAKKAGSKMADAKANHDAKEEAKWEKKKEKVIRSGNAKAVRKISDKLTDDELRRADNRINEKNRLDSMTGRQQQGQQFVQQKGNQNSGDFIKDFNSFVNTATTTYNSIDKIVKTYDDIQKYMPENRAKEARVKNAMKNVDADYFLRHPEEFNSQRKAEFLKDYKNYNQVFESEREKYKTPMIGPSESASSNNNNISEKAMKKWLNNNFSDYYEEFLKNRDTD